MFCFAPILPTFFSVFSLLYFSPTYFQLLCGKWVVESYKFSCLQQYFFREQFFFFSFRGGVIEAYSNRKKNWIQKTMTEKESAYNKIYVSSSEAFELSEELKFPHERNVISLNFCRMAAAHWEAMFFAVNVIAGNLLRNWSKHDNKVEVPSAVLSANKWHS